jgi:hypothetical protein
MKKNLLLLSALFVSALSFGQAAFTTQPIFPATVQQNQTVSVTFTYTSTVPVIYEFQIIKYNNAGSTGIYDNNFAYVSNQYPSPTPLPATATPSTVTVNLTVSPTATLSSTLPYQYTYGTPPVTVQIDKFVWFGKLVATGFSDTYAGNDPVTITTPLSVNSFNINSDEMYVTSAKSLVVKGNVNAESAIIYDMTGRSVASVKNLRASNIDLSALRNGVYFLVDNNKRTFKFAL